MCASAIKIVNARVYKSRRRNKQREGERHKKWLGFQKNATKMRSLVCQIRGTSFRVKIFDPISLGFRPKCDYLMPPGEATQSVAPLCFFFMSSYLKYISRLKPFLSQSISVKFATVCSIEYWWKNVNMSAKNNWDFDNMDDVIKNSYFYDLYSNISILLDWITRLSELSKQFCCPKT